MVWSIKNDEERIKLALEPPQLGSLFIEIHREKDNIKAVLWADNQATKQILESHQVELQKILKEDGFQLGQFDVFVQQNMKSFQERRDQGIGEETGGRSSKEKHGVSSSPVTETVPVTGHSSLKGNTFLDIFI